ncbi:MAG: hypothetical protein N3B17_05390 [Chlorobi bacterium]|nr:hypothetical protein [Chlorobiota bacterium]
MSIARNRQQPNRYDRERAAWVGGKRSDSVLSLVPPDGSCY